MAVAAAVFVAAVLFTTRRRVRKPNSWVLLLLASIVVVLGMLFARYAHIFFQPPWWIYYGFPAVTTFLLPPAVLRMTRREIVQYVPLAVLMAPAIHIFFSFFVGWHDYMPFPFYIPSVGELAQRIRGFHHRTRPMMSAIGMFYQLGGPASPQLQQQGGKGSPLLPNSNVRVPHLSRTLREVGLVVTITLLGGVVQLGVRIEGEKD